MSETNWPETYDKILFSDTTWLAQTFTAKITHDVKYIKVKIGRWIGAQTVVIHLQYLKPDGTPTGANLTSWLSHYPPLSKYPSPEETIYRTDTPWRIVAGVAYALVMHVIPWTIRGRAYISYQPPPGDYPRGKLIKSTNSGSTWDTTDLGDLVFAEWGNPPLGIVPWYPTVTNFAILDLTKQHYSTSICMRCSTSQPCFLTCHLSDTKPRILKFAVNRRGSRIQHFGTYSFVGSRPFKQLQKGDTILHSFRPLGLKRSTKYYYVFTGLDDWTKARSVSPIFGQRFPGGPAWEKTCRPEAPGDSTALSRYGTAPCPQNYCYVKEASADEWNSCVYNAWPYTKWQTDLYNIPDLDPGDTGPIGEVHLTGRFAFRHGYSYASGARIYIKTHGRLYRSDTFSHLGNAFENRHWHVELNPETGLPWTQQEIKDLQIGVSLYCYEGVGWYTETFCTQLYCKIKHSCQHPTP